MWSAVRDLEEDTRRSTASVTPPVTPKITPAPETVAKGIFTASGSSSLNMMPDSLIMRISSCVVSTTSTIGSPSLVNSGRAASNFLAVQGMMATWKGLREDWAL